MCLMHPMYVLLHVLRDFLGVVHSARQCITQRFENTIPLENFTTKMPGVFLNSGSKIVASGRRPEVSPVARRGSGGRAAGGPGRAPLRRAAHLRRGGRERAPESRPSELFAHADGWVYVVVFRVL